MSERELTRIEWEGERGGLRSSHGKDGYSAIFRDPGDMELIAGALVLMAEAEGEHSERGRRAMAIERWLRKLPSLHQVMMSAGRDAEPTR